MSQKILRILSLLLCLLLCFEQSGFTQVAAQLDIAGHLASLHSALTVDKFRPLHLRYLQFDPVQNNFRLLIDKGSLKNPSTADLENTSKELLRYFFIGLSLPNDTFWVNLRPDSPDQIIDPLLAQTDIGRILLESDLELKKDTAKATSPETPEGAKYWDSLYKKAEELFGSENITIPTLTRPWIVPDEIIIRETQDSAYIYKATLKVMLEQDYLNGSATYSFKDERLKALNEYSSQLIRELILPKLIKEVNTSKKYAALRQVYYSLILAQWFKARFAYKQNSYSHLIESRNLSGLAAKTPYSKDSYFKAYQKSFKDGEYNFQTPVSTPYGQTIRSYFSGGISGIAPVISPFGERPTNGITVASAVLSLHNPGPHSVALKTMPGSSPVAMDVEVEHRDREIKSPLSPMAIAEITADWSEENVAQIGKRAYVKEIIEKEGNKYAKVVDIQGRELKEIKLEKPGISSYRLGSTENVLNMWGPGHKQLFEELFKIILRLSPVEYYFDVLNEDLLGFALPEYKLYAIHNGILGHPIVTFHEACEYLIKAGEINLIINDDTIVIKEKDQVEPIAIIVLSNPEAQEYARRAQQQINDPAKYHYILRAVQRQLFGEKDRELTLRIKEEQKKKKEEGPPRGWLIVEDFKGQELERVDLGPVEYPEFSDLADLILRSRRARPRYLPQALEKASKYVSEKYPYFYEERNRIVVFANFAEEREYMGSSRISLPIGELGWRDAMSDRGSLKVDRGIKGLVRAINSLPFVYTSGQSCSGLLKDHENQTEQGEGFITVQFDFNNPQAALFLDKIKSIVGVGIRSTVFEKLQLLRYRGNSGEVRIHFYVPKGEKDHDGFLSKTYAEIERIVREYGTAASPVNKSTVLNPSEGKKLELAVASPDAGYIKGVISEYSSQMTQMTLTLTVGITLTDDIKEEIVAIAKQNNVPLTIVQLEKTEEKGIFTAVGFVFTLANTAQEKGRLKEFNLLPLPLKDTPVLKGRIIYSDLLDPGKIIDSEQDVLAAQAILPQGDLQVLNYLTLGILAAYHPQIIDFLIKISKEYANIGNPSVLASLVHLQKITSEAKEKATPDERETQDVLERYKDNLERLGMVLSESIEIIKRKSNLSTNASAPQAPPPPAGGVTSSSSSPSTSASDKGKESFPPGGIDFRLLPIVTQAVSNLSANLSRANINTLINVNLNKEWQEMERILESGIIPSTERIKDYLQASCAKGEIDQDKDKIISCIAEVLRSEEESCCQTEATLRDILVVLEASQSEQQLKEVFLGKVI